MTLQQIDPKLFRRLILELRRIKRTKHMIVLSTPAPFIDLICEDGIISLTMGEGLSHEIERTDLIPEQRKELEKELMACFMRDWNRAGQGGSYGLLG